MAKCGVASETFPVTTGAYGKVARCNIVAVFIRLGGLSAFSAFCNVACGSQEGRAATDLCFATAWVM